MTAHRTRARCLLAAGPEPLTCATLCADNITMRRLSLALTLSVLVPTLVAVPATADTTPRSSATQPVADVVRTAGDSRQSTAVEVSRHAHPWGARTVLLARHDHYADALAGGPLAAALEAPILLTDTIGLSDVVRDELRRLSPDEVLLLGGEGALHAAVADQVAAMGIRVERLSGPDRYATAAAIGDRLLAEVPPAAGTTTAVVVEGANANPSRGWPDAVAASALAAVLRAPVVLATTGELPAASAVALDRWDVGDAVLVGGEAALSPVVADAVRRHVRAVDRIAGADRYDTSARAADRAADAGASRTAVWLASGANWPDALVAGPAAAVEGGVLVLAPPSPTDGATADWLASHGDELRTVRLVGGTATLHDDHVAAARRHLPDAGAFSRWSDPATWGGRVPRAGDDVTIPASRRVLLDVTPPVLGRLDVVGELEVARAPGLRLAADVIAVSGRLGAGDPGRPFPHDLLVELHGDLDGPHAAGRVGTGALASLGGTLDLFGRRDARPWTTLARTAEAGDTVVHLAEPSGWQVGDRLAVAPSGLDPSEAEELVVAAVDGTTVTLAAPLAHQHWAAAAGIDEDPRTVGEFSEVALLTRSIRVTAADDDGGHVFATPDQGRAPRVHLSAVEFDRLGQAGVLGRYPVHFHLADRVTGAFVRDAAIHHSQQRCLTIHGTSDVRVVGLVAYATAGHCVFFEDGAEAGNVVHDSLVFGLTPPSAADRLLDTDRTPAAYWVQHPRNVLRFSNAAGGEGFGFWLDLPAHPTGPSATDEVENRKETFGVHRDLVAHSFRNPKDSGNHRAGTGLTIDDYKPPTPAVVERFTGWKNSGFGAWLEFGDVSMTDARLAGNGTGFLGNGASLDGALILGVTGNDRDRPYYLHGLGLYTDGDELRDVTIADFRDDEWRRGFAVGANTEHMKTFADLSGIRVVDSVPLSIRPLWSQRDQVSTGLVDVDGSLTGTPGTTVVSSDAPLLQHDGCVRDDVLDAHRCTGVSRTARLHFTDQGDGATDFRGSTMRRDDGRVGNLEANDPDSYEAPRATVTVLQDHGHTVSWTSTPAVLEVVHSTESVGSVTVTVPWPADRAFVYEGWEIWAFRQADAGSRGALSAEAPVFHDATAGTLTVLLAGAEADGEDTWRRWRLCAAANCGDGTGSARE